jgi:hypothetical protein
MMVFAIKCGSCAAGALSRMAPRVEPTSPRPWIFVVRHAGAEPDGADADVTIKDVPAFVVGSVGRAAAGKFGHALLKRGPFEFNRRIFWAC